MPRASYVYVIQHRHASEAETVFTVKYEAQYYLREENSFNLDDVLVHRFRDGGSLQLTLNAADFLAGVNK